MTRRAQRAAAGLATVAALGGTQSAAASYSAIGEAGDVVDDAVLVAGDVAIATVGENPRQLLRASLKRGPVKIGVPAGYGVVTSLDGDPSQDLAVARVGAGGTAHRALALRGTRWSPVDQACNATAAAVDAGRILLACKERRGGSVELFADGSRVWRIETPGVPAVVALTSGFGLYDQPAVATGSFVVRVDAGTGAERQRTQLPPGERWFGDPVLEPDGTGFGAVSRSLAELGAGGLRTLRTVGETFDVAVAGGRRYFAQTTERADRIAQLLPDGGVRPVTPEAPQDLHFDASATAVAWTVGACLLLRSGSSRPAAPWRCRDPGATLDDETLVVKGRKGRGSIRLWCAIGSPRGCEGRIRLEVRTPPDGRFRGRPVPLAAPVRFKLANGTSRTMRIRLTPAGRRLYTDTRFRHGFFEESSESNSDPEVNLQTIVTARSADGRRAPVARYGLIQIF